MACVAKPLVCGVQHGTPLVNAPDVFQVYLEKHQIDLSRTFLLTHIKLNIRRHEPVNELKCFASKLLIVILLLRPEGCKHGLVAHLKKRSLVGFSAGDHSAEDRVGSTPKATFSEDVLAMMSKDTPVIHASIAISHLAGDGKT